jgi:hypothetical protein
VCVLYFVLCVCMYVHTCMCVCGGGGDIRVRCLIYVYLIDTYDVCTWKLSIADAYARTHTTTQCNAMPCITIPNNNALICRELAASEARV